jgi:hypothetical protein
MLSAGNLNAKTYLLYTQAELSAAGVLAGDIDGLLLHVASGNEQARMVKIQLQNTTETVLSEVTPPAGAWTETYFNNINFTTGSNRIQFHTPFNWDGTSNIMIEVSYSNTQSIQGISFDADNTSISMMMSSSDDKSFYFDGSNYATLNSYKGIPGSESRTMEAWIKTTTPNKAIISWGRNSNSQKFIFRIDATGGLRVEVNGGYAIGPTNVADGQWHHVAAVIHGNTTSDIDFYVDGQKEIGLNVNNNSINTDTATGEYVRIAQDHSNRIFEGEMDALRVWSTDLDSTTIRDWMYRTVNNTHSAYSSLELSYSLDQSINNTIQDESPYIRTASLLNGVSLRTLKGLQHFKDFSNSTNRIQTTFLQGTYNLTITNDTLTDTVVVAGNNVKLRQVVSMPNTLLHDQLSTIMDTMFWEAGYEYIYEAASSTLIDSILLTADGSITPNELIYYKRYPAKYEIMSFVTPYGINLDLGPNGKTWIFDVTDYGPILKGKKRMTIERGGQWMEDMDIRFVYIVGTPVRDVLDIQQLWRPDSRSYTSIMAERSFESKEVNILSAGKSFKIRSAITGHGQQGEFIPQQHFIDIDGGSKEFSWQVWKACSENPIYPQGGTWIYDRAGWCPGAPTDVKEMDITSYVTAGQASLIDYGVDNATGTSNYIVNNQLVSYGDPNFSLDAAVVEIQTPSSRVEYSRFNTICNQPTILIQNTGSTTLTSLTIKYWANNNSTPSVYQWTGSLDFTETELVTLPVDGSLWTNISETNNIFNVVIEAPNGGTDEYTHNNTFQSVFNIPEVVPADFYIQLRTNLYGNETSYKIYDEAGNVVFHKTGLANNTTYRDTFHLGVGCYQLEVLDSDGDGLSFWANNDGNGSLMLRQTNGYILENFDGDFGGSLIYNFTIDYPMEIRDQEPVINTVIYPNPSTEHFTVDFRGEKAIAYKVVDLSGKVILQAELSGQYDNLILDMINQAKGIYMLQLEYQNKVEHKKLILN